MNFGSEHELRTRLGVALDLVEPGPLPLDTVIRRGVTVLILRRAFVVVALVVLTAAAVAGPKLAQHLARPLPAGPAQYHVTVNPPPKGSTRLIASGRVRTTLNNMPWSVSGVGSGKHFHLYWHAGSWSRYAGGQLFTGQSGGWDSQQEGLPATPRDPADIFDIGFTQPDFVAFTVRADVSYLLVSLRNGQSLVLQPVAAAGPGRPRLAAVAVPAQTSIAQISAYSVSGELGYTAPYGVLAPPPTRFDEAGSPDGQFEIVRWLTPSEPAPRPTTYSIGRGTALGTPWVEQLRVGPWGTCVIDPTGPDYICAPAVGLGLLKGKAAAANFAGNLFSQQHVGWDAIVARPSVSYILERLPHGRLVQVPIYAIDGAKFATVAWTGQDLPPLGWIAYSASGKVLASGPFP